jgi:hypothetical protein
LQPISNPVKSGKRESKTVLFYGFWRPLRILVQIPKVSDTVCLFFGWQRIKKREEKFSPPPLKQKRAASSAATDGRKEKSWKRMEKSWSHVSQTNILRGERRELAAHNTQIPMHTTRTNHQFQLYSGERGTKYLSRAWAKHINRHQCRLTLNACQKNALHSVSVARKQISESLASSRV